MSDPALGTSADPAWLTAQRRLILAGTVAAILAVLASGAAFAVLPILLGGRADVWAVVALAAAASMVVVCVLQQVTWRRAEPTMGATRASWIAQIASYAVVLLALIACLSAAADAGLGSVSAGLWTFELLLVLIAHVMAGVQYVRSEGPPGTIPAHLRRLRAWIKRAQEREDDEDPLPPPPLN